MAEGGQIPVTLEPFNSFVHITIPYLADVANQARLGVSDDNKDALVDALGAPSTPDTWIWLWARTSNEATTTKPLRDDRNALKKTITSKLREVYDDIPESALSSTDRSTLKIPKRDTEPTKRGAITTRPTLKLIVQGGARFIVENRVDKDQTRPSMHPDADHIELAYIIGATPPTSVNETNKVEILSKARDVLQLDPETGGQRIHCYTRWVNKTDKAKSSPWTRLHSAVISD
jgi:hypothetical protein